MNWEGKVGGKGGDCDVERREKEIVNDYNRNRERKGETVN